MSQKVQISTFSVCLCAQQCVQHANDFRTLFVHSDGVEIVYRFVFVRANRVRHGARVLRELARLHEGGFLDADDGGGAAKC